MLSNGMTDRDMAGELSITLGDLRNLKRELLADELEEIANDSPAEVWAKYRLRMEGCVSDLDEIIEQSTDANVRGGFTAAVGAVKAKAQILDNVLKKGQELGVLHREPKKSIVVGGIAVTSVALEDLRELVATRRASVTGTVTKYAPTALVDYGSEEDGDIYAEPELEKIPIRRKKVAKS